MKHITKLPVKVLIGIPLILSTLTTPAWSQSPEETAETTKEETMELPSLIVTGIRDEVSLPMDAVSESGSRLGLSAWELSGTVAVIDQQRMQERGDRTTTEAVTGATGFSSANEGGSLSAFSARGFNDVAVLYDGISMGNPGMFARPQGSWIYERIETISGPASILHGEGSIAGAVNFIPRRPNPFETETDLLMSVGSFNSTRVAVGHGGPTKVEGLSFRIDGESQTSDGYTDNSDLRRDTVSVSLRYDASDQLILSGNLVYLKDELPPYFGVPVDLAQGKPPSNLTRSNFNAEDATIKGEEWRLTFDAEYSPSDTVTLNNRFYAYKGKRDWENVESSEIIGGDIRQRFSFSLDHDQHFYANRSVALINHELFGSEALTSVGLEVSRDDFKSDRSRRGDIDRSVGNPNNPDTGSVDDIGFDRSEMQFRTKRDTLALFGENRLLLGHGFSLVSGLRGELIHLDVTENVSTGGTFTSDQETFTAGDAKLGFIWEATEQFSFFGQASTGSQLALSPNIPRVDEFDRDLERSLGFEFGLRGRAIDGSWEWQIAAFEIEKRNRLVTDPKDPPNTRQVGRQTSHGLEVSGYFEPFERLALEFNATILDAEYHDDNDYGGNTPANVPEQLANFWATWTVTERLLARAHVQYVGQAEANDENTLEIPSYTLLNLSSQYSLNDNWDVTIRVRNVTDELYYTQAQFGPQFYVGDGRSVELELKASF